MSALTVEECELINDSKYRSYITQVEKALKNFEYTSEWADLISALGKLNKVLLANVKYPVVPKRVTIGKRLAQCLHPALPSGVHLKALETYDIIFRCIGTQRLAQDLFVYSAGLFPLLGHASMSVKPVLLNLYERHFTVLGKHVKPGLNGLLLGLLPGLEEGSDYYDRTTELLEEFSEMSDPPFFYTCLWECIMSCPNIRLSAISYLLSHYKKKQSMEDQLYMIGLNIDLMVQAICSSVQDSSVLVQRSMLDFLLVAFPANNGQLTKADVLEILKACITVVLRRDMSLNRRLYAWLLGTDSTGVAISKQSDNAAQRHDSSSSVSDSDTSYFQTYSKDLLIQALKSKLLDANQEDKLEVGRSVTLKPFRILMSLLDKPEIGAVILENVLLAVFQCLYRECGNLKPSSDSTNVLSDFRDKKKDKVHDGKNVAEIVKTANLLFGTFEPYFIWDFIGRMFTATCQYAEKKKLPGKHSSSYDLVSLPELCDLVVFLLDIISVETFIETQTEHLPALLRQIATDLADYCEYLQDEDIISALHLCSKLLAKVQPSMTGIEAEECDEETGNTDVFDTKHSEELFVPSIKEDKEKYNHEHYRMKNDIHASLSTPVVECDTNKKSSAEKQTFDSNSTESLTVSESCLDADTSYVDISVKKTDEDKVNVCVDNSIKTAEKDVNDNVKPSSETSQVKTDGKNISEISKQPSEMSLKRQQSSINSYRTRRISYRSSYSRMNSNPSSHMQACIQCFQEFFHVFVTRRLLQTEALAEQYIESIKVPQEFVISSETDSVLDGRTVRPVDEKKYHVSASDFKKINSDHLTSNSCAAFSHACRLLVDFASFPVYCTDFDKFIEHTHGRGEEIILPPWLQDLIACSCVVKCFVVQSSAIATILDLIILTQSMPTESMIRENRDMRKNALSERSVPILVLPALLHKHLKFLIENILFYKTVAVTLWEYLRESTSDCHQRTVDLFHLLHQVSPNSWICEDIIGKDLVNQDQVKRIEAFKKFTILWHLTRDKKTDYNPGQPLRSFDRSMFVLLDNLHEMSSPTKTIVCTWLAHVVQRGDLSRVMEPLLLMLLHPDTARVSIQHVNIHKPKKVRLSEKEEEDNSEARIYAISSQGGNVIYHVSPHGNKYSAKSDDELKSCALTVVNDKGATCTTPVRSTTESEMTYEKVNPSDLKLRVNPFGSQSSLDKIIFEGFDIPKSYPPNLDGVHRLDRDTCKKEGISFDDVDDSITSSMESSVDTLEGDNFNSEEFMRQILDEIICHVVSNSEDSSLSSEHMRNDRVFSITSQDSSSIGDQDLLNSIDRRGVEIDSLSGSESDFTQGEYVEGVYNTDIHALHMHLLLYTQKYDYQRTVYALTTLKSLLTACPRLVVTAMSTTSISSVRTPHLAKLQMLLARHRKSVFGKNFFGELPPEVLSSYRSNMFIEIIISVCLYFIRSYYPNLMMSKLANEELLGNKEVHIVATEILTLLMSELVSIMKDSGKNFISYIADLLSRCKVQKALLHCVLAIIYNSIRRTDSTRMSKLTDVIISFNEENLDPSTNETFQIKLLNLLLIVIILEHQLYKNKDDTESSPASNDWDRMKINFKVSLQNVKYLFSKPIAQQAMFISGILSALKQKHMSHMHRHWIALVTSSLPYMGKALTNVVLSVVSQLCRNLEDLAEFYSSSQNKSKSSFRNIPPDHLITMLEGLTTLSHYCLLDNLSSISIGQPNPSPLPSVSSDATGTREILTNLINVFNPGASRLFSDRFSHRSMSRSSLHETSPQRDSTPMPPVLEARRALLSIMPRITACMATLWKAVNVVEKKMTEPNTEISSITLGLPKVIKQFVLEFLSPISRPHGVHLIAALAVAWNDRRKNAGGGAKKVIAVPCEDQLLLVDLLSAIKVLPTDTLMQTVKQVIKQPPPSELSRKKRTIPLEVNMLQFFLAYVRQTSASQLTDSWSSFQSLLRECVQLNLPPPAYFHLMEILNEFVQKTPTMNDKKNLKDLQELTQKVFESVSTIAGSCLEQTTWLRRNLAVKPGPQTDITDEGEFTEDTGNETESVNHVKERKVIEPQLSSNNESKYSVQALSLLAEQTLPLLDVVYGSDEKEKIAPFLTTILYNVFPYLRNHRPHNLPSLRASSQMLSSVSGYQYTRKAWRKEALELLLDGNFFQMDAKCISYWHSVIDNLMTHDKTTFKDLMTRVTVAQSGSLNLFTNKEQEFELRAQMLKRLAFTIFCSERDQYQRNLPDIQERLAESLRLPQVPSVMAQVFLTFRVLILRISPQHLTSLWPTIITELVQVFLQIEQELSTDTDEFKAKMICLDVLHALRATPKSAHNRTQLQRIAALDSSWSHLGNGLNAHNNPAWLQLYLSACKLLDLAMALPADNVPQFQLYRWAFIGGAAGEEDIHSSKKKHSKPCFTPHIVRISKLLNSKVQGEKPILKQKPGQPILTTTYLKSLVELQPFFNTLCYSYQSNNKFGFQASGSPLPKSQSAPTFGQMSQTDCWTKSLIPLCSRQYIEDMVERDFLEILPHN